MDKFGFGRVVISGFLLNLLYSSTAMAQPYRIIDCDAIAARAVELHQECLANVDRATQLLESMRLNCLGTWIDLHSISGPASETDPLGQLTDFVCQALVDAYHEMGLIESNQTWEMRELWSDWFPVCDPNAVGINRISIYNPCDTNKEDFRIERPAPPSVDEVAPPPPLEVPYAP